MKNVKDLLPIGSIVILKEGIKKLMVIGVMQEDVDGKPYDYLGLLYPEGFIGQAATFLFQAEDIREIFHRGYEDQERNEFLERLDEFYKENGQDGA